MNGHFVNRSIIMTICRFPLSVNGRSMTSIPSIWNGLETGMGCSGGLIILPTPVEIAHSGQALANAMESLNIPSHHQWFTNGLNSLGPEK